MSCVTLRKRASHAPIESAEKDASDEHGDLSLSQALDEASALQGHIASSHHTGLARRISLHEEVVWADSELSAFALQRRGASPDSDDDAGPRDGLGALLVRDLDAMSIHELGKLVQVGDALLSELWTRWGPEGEGRRDLDTISEVESLDVVLGVVAEGLPGVARGHPSLPAIQSSIASMVAIHGSSVHQLLGDTADVDTSATQSPFGACGGRLHEVEQTDTQLGVDGHRFFGTG
jgi:hypothetical protein